MSKLQGDVVTLPLDPAEYAVDPDPPRLRIRVEETLDTEETARQKVAAMMARNPGFGMPGIAVHLAYARGYCDECGNELWSSLTAEDICERCRIDRMALQQARREQLTEKLTQRTTLRH